MTSPVFPAEMLKKFFELCREDGVFATICAAARYLYGSLRLFYLRHVRKGEQTICKINDYSMLTFINRPGLAEELIRIGRHEKITSREIRKRLQPGDHVIDLGANIGYYAIMEALRVGTGGRVYAIEPVPENYDLLIKNIKLNKVEHIVQSYQLAIGNVKSTGLMNISKYMSQHSFLSHSQKNVIGLIEVPMIPFKDFIEEERIDLDRLSLVRMDIEGFEAKILPDIIKIVKGRKNISLEIEFHPLEIDKIPGHSFRDILNLVQTVTDHFDWILTRDGVRKIFYANIPIKEIIESTQFSNKKKVEVWISVKE
jgi:FkbM family methyltransferase